MTKQLLNNVYLIQYIYHCVVPTDATGSLMEELKFTDNMNEYVFLLLKLIIQINKEKI